MSWRMSMEHIEHCISFLLGKAYQQVNQAAKRRLAPYGVTPVQYALLQVLWEQEGKPMAADNLGSCQGGQSGAELGERLQLDAATITGVLDRLEHAQLVERRPHATDRRVNSVFLTAKGRDLRTPLEG